MIKDLLLYIKNFHPIYIQTHDFPDHDAVASAFAFQYILKKNNIESFLVYNGEIQRESLKELIQSLNIDIKHISSYKMKPSDKIIIVDGCKGNKNVSDLIGDEIAVIDHHNTVKPEDVHYADIRSNYGACSTIMFDYIRELGYEIPQSIANALLIGINVDTNLLTRQVSEFDITAYAYLYKFGNISFVNSLLRNYIQVKDIEFFKQALNNLVIKNLFAYCYFPDGCNQNLMGILGDFIMSLREVEFAVICAKNDGKINFSVRSEKKEWSSAVIVQEILKGIGFGGGHADMAGGIIPDISKFDEPELYKKMFSILNL